jgi:DNA ligase 1
MRLRELVDTSRAVGEVSGRLEKIGRLAALLERLAPEEIEIATSFLSGSPRQGRIGVGWALISEARAASVPFDAFNVVPQSGAAGVAAADAAAAARAAAASAAAAVSASAGASAMSPELGEVDEIFDRLLKTRGAGSTAAKTTLLRELFSGVTAEEQDFLARLLFGELRQGALEGVLIEAVARAARLPGATIRRAAMMAGTLAPVARAALVEGEAALARFMVQVMRPVQPMLADSAEDLEEAWTRIAEPSLEYKLDGARVQVHKADDDVRVFSRALNDVTPAVPEIVEIVRALPARELILDGEVIALRADGSPHPFQITMRRFGRRLDVDALRKDLPLTPFFFDALHLDGQSIIDEPQARRFDALVGLAPAEFVIPRIAKPVREAADAFLEDALRRGHEGVMAKSLAAPYAAGSRGQAWLKIKQARTLDLVVLAAEWGSGRRRGWLSNLHLGARDPERGGFVMLGKTFKGLTDALLQWQTTRFLEIELGRDGHVVHIKPEVVVEIAFNDIQTSPIYPGGLALRFARVKRYRTDKRASEADTIATVQDIFRQTTGQDPPARR